MGKHQEQQKKTIDQKCDDLIAEIREWEEGIKLQSFFHEAKGLASFTFFEEYIDYRRKRCIQTYDEIRPDAENLVIAMARTQAVREVLQQFQDAFDRADKNIEYLREGIEQKKDQLAELRQKKQKILTHGKEAPMGTDEIEKALGQEIPT